MPGLGLRPSRDRHQAQIQDSEGGGGGGGGGRTGISGADPNCCRALGKSTSKKNADSRRGGGTITPKKPIRPISAPGHQRLNTEIGRNQALFLPTTDEITYPLLFSNKNVCGWKIKRKVNTQNMLCLADRGNSELEIYILSSSSFTIIGLGSVFKSYDPYRVSCRISPFRGELKDFGGGGSSLGVGGSGWIKIKSVQILGGIE